MKILFLTSRLPYPPYGGDKNRVFSFIQELSRDHRIVLISFTDHTTTNEQIYKLKQHCEEVYTVLLPQAVSWTSAGIRYASPKPSQLNFYISFRMQKMIQAVSEKFSPHMAYIHLFRMMQYKDMLPKGTYTVLDVTDVISKELFRHTHYRGKLAASLIIREASRIRKYERKVCREVDEVWVISKTEKRDLQAAGGRGNIFVITNGCPLYKTIKRAPKKNTVVFYGHMSTDHNRNAAMFLKKEIMPRVQEKIQNVRFLFYGAGKRKKSYSSLLGITVKDDTSVESFTTSPKRIFSRSTILVAPIRFSAGTQTKIIEAMHAGLPVVTTPFGNEGIEGTHGANIMICRTVKEFSNTIISLLENPDIRENIGQKGSAYIRKKFSWKQVRIRTQDIEKNLLERI